VAGKTSNIAARLRQTCNKAAADWVANSDEHDRYISGDRFEHLQRKIGEHNDDIR
jgi:hypothetical protein